LSEKHNSFLRPLQKKGFKEERVTTIGLYDIGTSTTLESNKSGCTRVRVQHASQTRGVAHEQRRDALGGKQDAGVARWRTRRRLLGEHEQARWGWVCSPFQMTEDLADHLALRDSGNDPQRDRAVRWGDWRQ